MASGASQGAPTPQVHPHPTTASRAHLLQAVAWRHAWSVQVSFLIYLGQTDHKFVYKHGWSSPSNTPYLGSTPHTTPCTLFSFQQYLELARAIEEGLAPWKKERKLGMNTNRISSKVMLSFYKYSCAIELEYSFHVIIMTYELAYSFYAMLNMQNIMLKHSYNLYDQKQS